MDGFLNSVIQWSEVWALLIPLAIIILFGTKGSGMLPVVLYICIAFILNLAAIIISIYHDRLPPNFQNNNILYNLHSFVRVLLLGWYITNLKLLSSSRLIKIIIPVYILFVLVNFIFWGNPLLLSSRLFSVESIVLLLLSFLYFFCSMQDESKIDWLKHPSFLVCTAISLYEALSFFIFLFFYPLFEKNPEFGMLTMKIFSVTFLIFCILMALALRKAYKRPLSQNKIDHI